MTLTNKESRIDRKLKELLKKAEDRFPGKEITFCGMETNWEDCLTFDEFVLELWFNVIGTAGAKAKVVRCKA